MTGLSAMPTRSARRTARRSAPTDRSDEVEGHHERRLDEDEVETQHREEPRSIRFGRVIEVDDDNEPERWPVQDAGLVWVPSLVLRGERASPVVDVD